MKFEDIYLNKEYNDNLIELCFTKLLKDFSEVEQSILFKTSLLDVFDLKIAKDLTGIQNIEEIINCIKIKIPFGIQQQEKSSSYLYKFEFIEFVRKYLKNTNIELFRKTHIELAKYFELTNKNEESVKHAFLSENTDFFINLIKEKSYDLLISGKTSFLKTYLEKIPSSLIDNDFYLSAFYALVNATDFQLDFAEKLLHNANKILKKDKSNPNNIFKKSLIYYVGIIIYSKKGNNCLVRKFANKIIGNENELNRYFLGSAYYFLGYISIQNGDFKSAIREFGKSINFFKLFDNKLPYLRSFGFLARTFLYKGELEYAKKQFVEIIDEYNKNNFSNHIDLFTIYSDLARISCNQNKLKEGKNYLKIASHFVDPNSTSLIYYYITEIHMRIFLKELVEVEFFLDKAKELVINKNMDRYLNVIYSFESLLLILKGKSYLVNNWVEENEIKIKSRLVNIFEYNFDKIFFLYNDLYPLLLFYLETGKYVEGLNLIKRFYQIASQLKMEVLLIELLILKVLFTIKLGEAEKSKVILKQALVLGEKENCIGLFVNAFNSIDIKNLLIEIIKEKKEFIEKDCFINDILKSFSTQKEKESNQNLLSNRETEILRALEKNKSLLNIATDFDLSINTLKTYLKRIYKKLGVNNRYDAVIKGLK